MRYNHHLQNHFGSCLLLARAHDAHRGRDVQLRALPGEFDVVGVTDGTDAWLAPATCRPFGVDVAALLQRVRDGTHTAPRGRPRHALAEDAQEPQPAPRRRRVIEE